MLNVSKKRARKEGLEIQGPSYGVEGDAEKLTFKDDSMDGYTIAFGIRNVTHIGKVLAEAYRVLKKGGRQPCRHSSFQAANSLMTASQILVLRLTGIGRNEFIDIINKCRSKL
ncbi:hypothetical protein L1987_85912 [Smallanthus sonchifolius]|uniref:Uncharacterized protein n=1 Tax=Smallanthus sonchifolius TaxID=185202 RepID=A0ACB8XY15_9ASTR|nr:hypothetical protein L1987_85912 [Smallanthus sonchifolius]